MDIPKRRFLFKSLIFLKSNFHAKMAPDKQTKNLLVSYSEKALGFF